MNAKDRIAAIIATGLVCWGLVLMIGLVWRGGNLSSSGGEIFLAIATGLVASLGMYFATKNGNNNKHDSPPQDTNTTTTNKKDQ